MCPDVGGELFEYLMAFFGILYKGHQCPLVAKKLEEMSERREDFGVNGDIAGQFHSVFKSGCKPLGPDGGIGEVSFFRDLP